MQSMRYQCLDGEAGGGGGGTGKGAAFDFFLHFFGQIPDPRDWKIAQI